MPSTRVRGQFLVVAAAARTAAAAAAAASASAASTMTAQDLPFYVCSQFVLAR